MSEIEKNICFAITLSTVVIIIPLVSLLRVLFHLQPVA